MKNYNLEKYRLDILSLRNDTLNRCNKILELLEYPAENLLLGTDLELLYPYIVTAQIKLDIKTVEKYINSPNSHGVRYFIDNYISPAKVRYGNLVCPLYTDNSIGIHNIFTFTEDCLNDLFLYFLNNDSENFKEIVDNFLTRILESQQLRREYNIAKNDETLNINKSDKLKRDSLITYLKNKGLL